jgi:hypothetical protein
MSKEEEKIKQYLNSLKSVKTLLESAGLENTKTGIGILEMCRDNLLFHDKNICG